MGTLLAVLAIMTEGTNKGLRGTDVLSESIPALTGDETRHLANVHKKQFANFEKLDKLLQQEKELGWKDEEKEKVKDEEKEKVKDEEKEKVKGGKGKKQD